MDQEDLFDYEEERAAGEDEPRCVLTKKAEAALSLLVEVSHELEEAKGQDMEAAMLFGKTVVAIDIARTLARELDKFERMS